MGTLMRKTQRQPVDPEDGLRAREEPADHRTEHRRRAEHREEVGLVAGALPGRDEVAEDRDRQRHEATGAEALDAAVGRQLVHRVGRAGQQRADDEDRDRDHVQRLAAVDVGELAVQRRRDRRGQQVRRGHPRLQGQAVQVVADGPDRRRDDGLVERGEEHAEHQAAEDREDLAVRRRRRTCRRGVGGGRCSAGTSDLLDRGLIAQDNHRRAATTVHPRCVPRHARAGVRGRINASARGARRSSARYRVGMPTPATGPLRLARAGVVAVVTVALAALAHVLAGGVAARRSSSS